MVETQNFRFIPAGAGNTAPLKICTKAIAVYPRWRGEHYFCNAQRYSRIGLSPLARGTLYYNRWTRYGARFIPAGAGNTWRPSSFKASMPVYPRWRGEHGVFFILPSCSTWFIPAGAGNTGKKFIFRDTFAVYPRWRGEHPFTNYDYEKETGLSPLARGTRDYISSW